jgi:pimeloyl-ACP methyl ester carboxylesterase
MDIVLIPGFWLDGDSWADVAEPLRAAGHAVHPLTLPGLRANDGERSAITLRDQIDAVIATVDGIAGPVVLVGHSGGGAVAYGVADARPDSVARLVYVDSVPLAPGDSINDGLPVVHGEIPLPDWAVFDEDDLTDLTDELRDRFRSIAIPQPARVASDPMQVSDPRRFAVPATVICCEYSADTMRGLIAEGHPYVAELALAKDYELIDLPTGHWPQLTRPGDLAEAILMAVERRPSVL